MPRARNIKPSLFKNEILGVEDPLLTILFEGLWCLADREGKLEDRPMRIKAEIFPYRDGLDVNGYLTVLERLDFIRRYEAEKRAFIKVINFEKHQNPHHTEKASHIPDPPKNIIKNKEIQNNGELTVKTPKGNGYAPADSGFLIPDSKRSSEKKFSDDDLLLAKHIHDKIRLLAPKAKPPNFDKWADTIRKMRDYDGRTHAEIRSVFDWANTDEFWQGNILSPDKLRKQFDRLQIQSSHKAKEKRPATDDEWIALGQRHGITPKIGESMWDYKQRVSKAVYGN